MNPSREGFIAFFGGPAWFAGLRGGRDQTGLPQICVGLSIGGSRHHPCPLRLVDGGSTIDAAGAVACCVGAPLSDRQKALPNAPLLTTWTTDGSVLSCSCATVCLQVMC